jgi:sulfur carrier protein ThiS
MDSSPRLDIAAIVFYNCFPVFTGYGASIMQIKVNGQAIEIFSGARVKDALRQYSVSELKRVQKHEKKVCDRHGHEVALDGELGGGEELVVTPGTGPESRS